MNNTLTLTEFASAYIECALWSESADCALCDSCGKLIHSNGTEPSDCPKCGAEDTLSGYDQSFEYHNFGLDDLAPEALAVLTADCIAFELDNEALLISWYECGESPDGAGHDFWLTRNRHGAGFWDRFSDSTPEGKIGRQLTDAAHAYGSVSLYLGDAGKVYAQ